MFKNPILSGFYPDPSICRVEEDYYMITSTFGYFPGVPIFHSRDLVNWNQIGHVLDRPSQLNLDGAGLSGGIYAPTIRYHQGTFYMITTNITNGGNFIVTTKDPAGPWSDPYWIKDASGIDPSLFFDEDGKVYYTGTAPCKDAKRFGDMEIWCQELDLETMTLLGERKGIWKGALKDAHCPEGPHIYKINGYYYLLISEGGTQYHHAVTIARSRSIFGPYEGNPGNPILTHRHLGREYPICNVGHADFIQTQTGEWWAVALGSRSYGGQYQNLGRETFLIPMKWEDEWPVMSPGTGCIADTYKEPNLAAYTVLKVNNDEDFEGENLAAIWNGIRTPREEYYSLKERPGFLRLKVRPQKIVDELKPPFLHRDNIEEVIDHPSFIGRRQQHINFVASSKMEFTPENEYEVAGIALIQNNNFQYRVEHTLVDGQRVIRLIKCTSITETNYMQRSFKSENIETVLVEIPFEAQAIYIKVVAYGQNYNFYYGDCLGEIKVLMENVDGSILNSNTAGGFVGTYIGMFATSNGRNSRNVADFDWFNYQGL